MNFENINERLLRTERERDEARAEVEKIKAREAEGVALFDSLLARERAELARLRAAANDRASEELTTIVLGVSDIAYDYVGDGRGVRVPRGEVRDLIEQRIAALRAETPAPVPPPVTPPADAPNDPTKNVCAIRRRSDGYWWECNGEHGAGWNDKRIRQAWTHRAAHVEVERMKASGVRDDVEVVELAPKPSPEATSGYRSLDHAIRILSGCLAPYSGEQAQAVATALTQMHDRSTPPADAPSRPSVEALQYWTLLLRSRDLSESQCNAVLRLLLDDALAGRGEGAK